MNQPVSKVVHLTSVHVQLDIRIFHKECRSLANAGFQVVLIAPEAGAPPARCLDGLRIRSVPKPVSRRERLVRTVWQVYRAAVEEDADIYHFHDPELIPIGLMLKLRGKRVVYDVHEDMPRQVLTRHWIPTPLRKPLSLTIEILESLSARIWDGVVAVTPTIERRFPQSRRALVQNFPMPDELSPKGAIPYASRPESVAYVGKIERVRGAEQMVEAMGHLEPTSSAHLLMAGTYEPASLESDLQDVHGHGRVISKGWLNRSGVAALLGEARIGLVLLHPVDNYIDAQPIKLFEYMAAGIPVVASNFPRWRTIIESRNCGLLVDPLDPKAIAHAIEWLLDHPQDAEAMGQRGRLAVESDYSWDHEAAKLIDFYRSRLSI